MFKKDNRLEILLLIYATFRYLGQSISLKLPECKIILGALNYFQKCDKNLNGNL